MTRSCVYLYFVARGNVHVPIHRAVCAAWHGPGDGLDARHLDGNSLNNAASNLAWGTRAENMADAKGHGSLMRGERHYNAVLDEGKARRIKQLRREGRSYQKIADEMGLKMATVYGVGSGRTWAHVE